MFKKGPKKPKPIDTPFRQQSLPAWQPILSPPWVIGCFFLVAVVFLPIGALIIVASGQVSEYEVRYAGDTSSCNNPPAGVRCEEWVSITLTADMQPPVYMYYGLENFYQNHRRMFKSRSDTQLSGGQVGIGDIDDCTPVRYPGDLQNTGSAGNSITNLYAPCGLIAWTMFNDSFTVYVTDPSSNCSSDPTQCGSPICVGYLKAFPIPADVPTNPACTDNGVAWDSDVDRKFKTPYSNSDGTTYIQSFEGIPAFYNNEGPSNTTALIEGHALPVQTDQDFMVWMRVATLPTFRKLYRIFPSYTGFKKGSVVWIRIYNRFPVSSFGGKKYIVLSTTTWIGGKNYFMGIAYVVVGCICFFLGVVFAVKHICFRRNTGSDAFA